LLWQSKGGVLHRKSPERKAFLKRIQDEKPDDKPLKSSHPHIRALSEKGEIGRQ